MPDSRLVALLLVIIGMTLTPHPAVAEDPKDSPEICFGWHDRKKPDVKLDPGEGDFTAELLDQKVTLSGGLHDTTAINLFYVVVYDGFRVHRNRLYVKDRTLKRDDFATVWCTAAARISKVDVQHQDHNEIEIIRFDPVDLAPVKQGLEQATKWVADQRATIDLNEFKKSARWKRIGREVGEQTNLNTIPFTPIQEIQLLDSKRGIAEFLCGRHILAEVQHHHGHYLDFVAVYDVRNKKLLRVIVAENGYFLE